MRSRLALRLTLTAVFTTLWREVVLPSRGTWATLATVWILIFALHLANRTTLNGDSDPNRAAPSPEAMLAVWQAQRQQLAEFLPVEVPATEAPAAPAPRRHDQESAIPRRWHVG